MIVHKIVLFAKLPLAVPVRRCKTQIQSLVYFSARSYKFALTQADKHQEFFSANGRSGLKRQKLVALPSSKIYEV